MQYFIRLSGYQEEALFDTSTLVLFRKRVTIEMVMEANESALSRKDECKGPPSVGSSGQGSEKETGDNGPLTIDATDRIVSINQP